MVYYIRKTWEDKDSQIGNEFTNLREAIQKCEYGYMVFSDNGTPLIGTTKINGNNNSYVIDYSKIVIKLKDHYQLLINDIKRSEETNDELSLIQYLELKYYTEFLNKIEQLENEYKGV